VRDLVYQVFVDRFAGPEGRPLEAPPAGVDPWKHHCGGTLDGITARLPHIVGLGADALYLTPIFRAPSNHKYDTASFDEVDPRFGGEGAFNRLAAACKEKKLGLILDGVFNHVGEEHAWFREARANAGSKRAAFFRFQKHPDEYAKWRGFGHLPELDLSRPEVMAALFDGESSVARKWLRRGATGWRLDCANDIGLDACSRAAEAAWAERAPDGVVGEVMTWAEDWVADGRLDAVMNYWFRETVVGLVRGEIPAEQAAYNLKRMAKRWRRSALLSSWNVLATHDTPRLASLVPDATARRFCRALSFALPGTPLVYYGEEIGMEGGPDPDNRRPMIWDEAKWDHALLKEIARLVSLRKKHPALRTGDHLPLPQPGSPKLLAFARTTERPEEVVLCVANASAEPLTARVFAPYSFLFDALPLRDLLESAPECQVSAGSFSITLPPWGVALYAPVDGTIPGYRFFRR